VAAWVIVDRRNHLEAAPFVERGRLKRERHQDDLRAAAPARFLFGGVEQLRSKSAVTPRLFHPELAQLTGAAPGVAANPGNDGILLADKERQQPAVVNPGGP